MFSGRPLVPCKVASQRSHFQNLKGQTKQARSSILSLKSSKLKLPSSFSLLVNGVANSSLILLESFGNVRLYIIGSLPNCSSTIPKGSNLPRNYGPKKYWHLANWAFISFKFLCRYFPLSHSLIVHGVANSLLILLISFGHVQWSPLILCNVAPQLGKVSEDIWMMMMIS